MTLFLLMILTQEYHLPNVASQKTILPCPLPASDTLMGQVVDMFDTSKKIQGFYKFIADAWM